MAKSKKQPAKRQPKQSKKQPEQTLVQKLWDNKARVIMIVLLVAVPVAVLVNQDGSGNNGEPQAQAQEQKQQEEQDGQEQQPAENEQKPADKKDQPAAASYDYTAQPDDTYSQIARKAIQTYGVNNNVNLTSAQIIYAETLLTQEAGSPLLNAGQKVTLKESTVKSWVEKAQKLSDAQEKAWEAYAVGVNFDTNRVGQAS